jgi:integrase
MQEIENPITLTAKRIPWNKGKITGAKPPLRPKHVWAIRTMLQTTRQARDLALFNLAIDSKLRGCDVVAVRVDDVAPNGYAVDRATVRQRKTGRPVRFELTEQTRQAIDDYIKLMGKKSGEFLFTGRRPGAALRPVSMHGTWQTGSPALIWTRTSTVRTRCDEKRQRSFTGAQAISERSSCSSGIAR